MYFFLSKIFGLLLVPTNFLFLAGIFAVILLAMGRRTVGLRILLTTFLAFVVLCFTPIGYALLLPLESRFPTWAGGEEPYGIIVLGGGLDLDASAGRNEPVSGLGIDRILHAARLAREFPAAKIVYTGGSSNLMNNSVREADYAIRLFTYLGIPESRIIVERSARNTVENAAFVRDMISTDAERHWLLVTSSFHMPRAAGLFRNAGLHIDPVPVGWLTGGSSDLMKFTPGIEGLTRVNIAVREWIGLAVARVSGRTTEFFPRPR